MASDPQEIVVGALRFGASALTGNALLLSLAGGIGINWSAEDLWGLWHQGASNMAPDSPLTRAEERAIRRAVAELRKAYRKQYGQQADTAAFERVVGCAGATAVYTAVSASGVTAQRILTEALAGLLHDYEERQVVYLGLELLPATAKALQAELDADADAWQSYQGQLIATLADRSTQLTSRLQRLPEIIAALENEAQARRALADSFEYLEQEIVKLRNAIARRAAGSSEGRPVGAAYIDSAVAHGGGTATLRSNHTDKLRRSEGISADELYEGSAIAKGPGSQALVEHRYGGAFTPDPSSAPGRPPALVLTLQLTPTAEGARVRWSADEIGAYISDFVSPYRGLALATMLRALERRQHPAFALADGDHERLRALGLVEDDTALPDDLPQRVGRRLYAALVSGPGLAALEVSRTQAMATSRPLALRLLVPPGAVELAALPWELLWPAQGLPLLLSAQPSLLFTRHLDLDGPLPAFGKPQARPLRILALTPQAQRAPADLTAIQAKLSQLWQELKGRGVAEVTEVSPVTRDDLARAMSHAPDIVQYTGHGWYAEGRGVLLLDPATPGPHADRVDADQIAVALRGARMVVLSACRGAQGAGIEAGSASLLTGIAPALSAAGVPLVVGMQLGVSVDGALRASEAIYSAIARGLSVQAAVGRARDELYVAESARSSWYVPTLYVRTREPGPIFLS